MAKKIQKIVAYVAIAFFSMSQPAGATTRPDNRMLPFKYNFCVFEMKDPHKYYYSSILEGSFEGANDGEHQTPMEKAFYKYVSGSSNIYDWVKVGGDFECSPAGNDIETANLYFEASIKNIKSLGREVVRTGWVYNGR